jgi:hypothetical protein
MFFGENSMAKIDALVGLVLFIVLTFYGEHNTDLANWLSSLGAGWFGSLLVVQLLFKEEN